MFTIFPPIHLDPNDDHPNYFNEHVLYPTLSRTSFYHFTNPLSLPLYNNPYDNEQSSIQLYLLTAALTPKPHQIHRTKLTNVLSITTTITSKDETKTPFWTTINLLTHN